MRIPQNILPLVEMGIIDEVVRPLMSGKEAEVYVVVAGGEERVAKVYKHANVRSFKQRTDYTDGRKVRNSRDRRAMSKGTRHGRSQEEAAWRSTEVDVIYKLHAAGVRVPVPYNFAEGVLVMELVLGSDGRPAPRLGDVSFSPEEARAIYDRVLQDVVRMLCAGVVHGDLSDFNVLMAADGPVIIDFPQAVDPAANSGARRLLMRDVDNLHRFLSRSTSHPSRPYAQEMWSLLERNELTPDTRLGGRFRERSAPADTRAVLDLVGAAERDARRRGGSQQPPASRRGGAQGRGSGGPQVEVLVRSADGRTRSTNPPAAAAAAATPSPTPKKRRRRRRRSSSSGPSQPAPSERR
jgi:RIO kinase 1